MIPLRLPASPLGSALSLLLTAYGRQGWWPLPSRAGKSGFDEGGYHPGQYDWPRSRAERFEIVLGAALTQNTAWLNAEKALRQLLHAGVRTPGGILELTEKTLAALIRPAGYFNQKAKKLRALASFFREPRSLDRAPARDELLSIWGVGPETADSILLYAFHVPTFVVDAYTMRFLARAGLSQGLRPVLPPLGLSQLAPRVAAKPRMAGSAEPRMAESRPAQGAEYRAGLSQLAPRVAAKPRMAGSAEPRMAESRPAQGAQYRAGLSQGLSGGTETYEGIQALFHKELPARHELFNESHALIVAHCKSHCRKIPVCEGCPVVHCPRVAVE